MRRGSLGPCCRCSTVFPAGSWGLGGRRVEKHLGRAPGWSRKAPESDGLLLLTSTTESDEMTWTNPTGLDFLMFYVTFIFYCVKNM